jgi:mannosyltransferase
MGINKESKLLNLYIPLILVLIGFFWKFIYIGTRDISIDEPFTIFHAQNSVAEIIKMSSTSEPNPPLFMLLIHFWIKLFGIGPFSVRFLPLLFNALTVLFIYLTGKRFISFWAGLVASGLFLVSDLHFIYGLNTRTYSLLSLETAASLYFFLCYAENQKNRKALAGLIISNLLLVYSHYFGWFVIVSQVICSFFYTRNMKMFFRFMIPPVVTAVAFTPMIPAVIRLFHTKSQKGTWLNPVKGGEYLNQLYSYLNFNDTFWLVLAVIVEGIIFTLIIVYLKKWKRSEFNPLVLLLWWIIPYSIMFFTSFKVPMFSNSYNLFNSIGLYLFIPAAISFLFQKDRYFEPAFGLLVLLIMGVYMRILPRDFSYREVRKPVNYVKSIKNEKNIVIIYPFWYDLPFAYYYDRDIFRDPENFSDLMKAHELYNVWGLPGARRVVELNPGKGVIYVQDGNMSEQDGNILTFLDSTCVKRDSLFFPQTLKVVVYDPKPADN